MERINSVFLVAVRDLEAVDSFLKEEIGIVRSD